MHFIFILDLIIHGDNQIKNRYLLHYKVFSKANVLRTPNPFFKKALLAITSAPEKKMDGVCTEFEVGLYFELHPKPIFQFASAY
jgi:hypothetical protein